MEDLGIADTVNSVVYNDGFFDYHGVAISMISLNCANPIKDKRYVDRNYISSPTHYIPHSRVESAAFDFTGHFGQQETNLRICVKFSDKNQFLKLITL